MIEHVEASCRKTSFTEAIANSPKAPWRQFRALQNGCIACCERQSDRACTKDVRCVPEVNGE